ncbi:YwmB family TATA-box binding protein [Lentibacillus saliphilus]|uniref:YwmB family TATA-box binding protein n=1 Tax=Lentibacillus saliphilus TaxID=2737028 RepID=UPI001C304026|nr:YwmB family TATA-box binding protein [Lentibacillus saliphilus]
MRKIVESCLMVSLIILPIQATAAINTSDPLVTLAQFTKEELGEVEKWEVTMKEKQPRADLKKLLDTIKQNDHNVTVEKTKNAVYYKWTNTHPKQFNKASFKIIIPTNHAYDAELIVAISGNSWNDDVEEAYLADIRHINENYFTKNVSVFACLTTKERDILSDMYVEQVLKEKLNLTYITEQTDVIQQGQTNTFYGYTNMLTNQIDLMDKPMNVQLVVHDVSNDGQRQKLTLGTPILINEY